MTTSADQTNASVRGQFGAVAAAYAASGVHSSGPDLRALVEAAALTGTERVLDMGCGAGHTALAVAPLAARVAAVDLTPQMIGVAEALAAERGATNVTFRLADVTALPFEDASFDVVTCRFSAHHYADPARAVREAARVLRPGGRFLLVDTIAPEDPALDTFYQAAELLRDISHVRNWRGSEWSAMLAAAGGLVGLGLGYVGVEVLDWLRPSHLPRQSQVAIDRTVAAFAVALSAILCIVCLQVEPRPPQQREDDAPLEQIVLADEDNKAVERPRPAGKAVEE